jgi:DNA ligase-1
VLFLAVADTSVALATTGARTRKVARLAELLRTLDPAEIPPVVSWLSGDLTQRQIGVGWASLRELPEPAEQASLAVLDVERSFSEIGGSAGPGSQAVRRRLVDAVFTRATSTEQRFLRSLLTGDLRQGALAGLMTAAIAEAADIPAEDVRRALTLCGDLAAVASAALTGGSTALAAFGLTPGRPLGPMLAQTAAGVAEALTRLGGTAAFEWKLDGIRLQIHRVDDDGIDRVRLFTRSLDDITARLPEVVAAVRGLSVRTLVADAEVIGVDPAGRPRPFQVTASRTGTRLAAARQEVTVRAFLFDVLHVDGTDLIDEPAHDRIAVLERVIPEPMRVRRLVTSIVDEAGTFLDDALAAGHEGVVAKSLTAAYEAGRRGGSWLKIKPVHTLDLVVLAVERGSGRRRGTLSNIHLGARDPASGGFVMLGKTFKGMTDQMLQWQTRRFSELATGSTDSWVVTVRPEQVVEIAFDGVQRSSRYPGGVALRFARVVRYRDDKTAEEADTIDAVRAFQAP